MDSFLSGIWEVFGDDFGINFFNGDEQRPEIDAMGEEMEGKSMETRRENGLVHGK